VNLLAKHVLNPMNWKMLQGQIAERVKVSVKATVPFIIQSLGDNLLGSIAGAGRCSSIKIEDFFGGVEDMVAKQRTWREGEYG